MPTWRGFWNLVLNYISILNINIVFWKPNFLPLFKRIRMRRLCLKLNLNYLWVAGFFCLNISFESKILNDQYLIKNDENIFIFLFKYS
jgi:hypothetical protein